MSQSVARQELVARVAELRGEGLTTAAIGRALGVTKGVVIGIITRDLPELQHCWRGNRYGLIVIVEPPVRTTMERLDALHARFDALLVREPGHYQPRAVAT